MLRKLLYLLIVVLAVGVLGKTGRRMSYESQLLTAVSRGDGAATTWLLSEGTNPNSRNHSGIPLLGIAFNNGSVSCAVALLKANANARDGRYGYHLSRAIEAKRTELALLLIERGCPLETADMYGQTPLMYAAYTGNYEVAERLIRHGADLEKNCKPEGDGCTPLMFAAGAGDAKMVRLMLRYGARINARSYRGKTSLCYALERDRPEVVKVLLEAGAKQEEINAEKEDALTVAQQLKRPQLAALLQSNDSNKIKR
jgi:ankyrin repeat protein